MGTTTLVGYTGFVGTTLRRQTSFDLLVNRANLDELAGHRCDLLVCAAAPAAKWIANQQPDADRANIERLLAGLSTVTAERFVLISTVDVYPNPVDVDEATAISADHHHAYGRNRLLLEREVQTRFPQAVVVRLPALFGQGLKKNFVYDLYLGRDEVGLTHRDSEFQFYDMDLLWGDLQRILDADLPLVNVATEPLSARRVAREAFGRDHISTEAPQVTYRVRSRHASVLGRGDAYHYGAEEMLDRLRAFASTPDAVA
ncbi:MAG: NAD-dependent epimerase/dehydratase family protein [Actinobacteria bacterium]|nr:NAD-dependent epimerase/dehydratase family protein [Actinomycetota bacterium]